ncbi:MAG: hypothetical protein GKR90_08910 [Pseudomonadales bacterium]|nr:hypothetical protein [Pseudomonadales bacterium]
MVTMNASNNCRWNSHPVNDGQALLLVKWKLAFVLTAILPLVSCTTTKLPSPVVPLGQLILAEDTRLVAPNDLDHTGEATYIFPDGTKWVGTFQNGLLQGHGREEMANGIYEGRWRAGMRSGQGKQTETTGAIYEGQWDNDQRHGLGAQVYADETGYEGEWAHGQRSGFGSWRAKNGAQYEGNWDADKRHGYGVASAASGVVYEGMWENDKRSGFGRETRPDQTVYQGYWANNAKFGDGTETYPDTSSHTGQWQDGQVLGMGHRTSRAGIVFSGAWTRHVVSHGLVTFPNGSEFAGHLFADRGKSVTPSFLRWLQDLANAGDGYAQYFLALAHLDYLSPERDTAIAEVWLQAASREPIPDAHYRLSILLKDNDAQGSVQLLEKAAGQGHGAANAILGEYYHVGQHVKKDLNRAIIHYEQAVDQGVAVATNNLAWLLATNGAEPIDPTRAIELIQPLAIYTGNWQYLDTLAAAHARLQNFRLAESIQSEAIRLSQHAGQQGDLVADLQARLALYQKDVAYLEN